jgi:hypothetical protein
MSGPERRAGRRAALLAALLCVAAPSPLRAQEAGDSPDPAPTLAFDGELRLRGEADGRTVGVGDDYAVLSRLRMGARVGWSDWIRVYARLQDARAWGEESSTLTDASADALDIHEAWAELGRPEEIAARLGRQELALADERLVGAVGWTNTGRSFDGARAHGRLGDVAWTAFWMNVAERDSLTSIGLDPQGNQGRDDDGWLLGAHAATDAGPVRGELTLLHDRNGATDESWTANLRVHGRTGGFLFDAAGAWQGGPDRRAWFASGRAGAALGRLTLAAQADLLSGDDEPGAGDRTAFHTLYATNHKFYGYMDYFLAIPGGLDEAGLVDAILRASWRLSERSTLRADLHRFWTAEKRGGESALGSELDLVGDWRFAAPATLEAGGGMFFPEPLAEEVLPAFAGGDDATWWGYAQLTLRWP